MIKIIKTGSRGFTMIELVVSVTIIAVMSAIFLANYHGSDRASELNLTAQKVVSDIRLAQNFSLSSKELSPGVSVPGGWGVRVSAGTPNNAQYVIFADQDSNKAYSDTELYRTINLPIGIIISSVTINNVTTANPVDIVFLPPDPVTYINGVSNSNVGLTLSDNYGNSKIVSINFLGLVDVN